MKPQQDEAPEELLDDLDLQRRKRQEDLWVSSSSVFPTGGISNPTHTIVALTLRLADHLKDVLKS